VNGLCSIKYGRTGAFQLGRASHGDHRTSEPTGTIVSRFMGVLTSVLATSYPVEGTLSQCSSIVLVGDLASTTRFGGTTAGRVLEVTNELRKGRTNQPGPFQ
jgi:hypothetical protein